MIAYLKWAPLTSEGANYFGIIALYQKYLTLVVNADCRFNEIKVSFRARLLHEILQILT